MITHLKNFVDTPDSFHVRNSKREKILNQMAMKNQQRK